MTDFWNFAETLPPLIPSSAPNVARNCLDCPLVVRRAKIGLIACSPCGGHGSGPGLFGPGQRLSSSSADLGLHCPSQDWYRGPQEPKCCFEHCCWLIFATPRVLLLLGTGLAGDPGSFLPNSAATCLSQPLSWSSCLEFSGTHAWPCLRLSLPCA